MNTPREGGQKPRQNRSSRPVMTSREMAAGFAALALVAAGCELGEPDNACESRTMKRAPAPRLTPGPLEYRSGDNWLRTLFSVDEQELAGNKLRCLAPLTVSAEGTISRPADPTQFSGPAKVETIPLPGMTIVEVPGFYGLDTSLPLDARLLTMVTLVSEDARGKVSRVQIPSEPFRFPTPTPTPTPTPSPDLR